MKPNDTQSPAAGEEQYADIESAGADTEDFTAQTIAALEAENAEFKDRLLRALAEVENLRRRAARDVADARTYSVTNFARDMLTVADNIRRALDAVPDETLAVLPEGPIKGVIEGVTVTERDLLNTLERHGVRKLDPKGERFDPHFHQAMFEIPNPDVYAGTVLDVMQVGYTIGDRVLRPAMVGIAKGGPKAPPATTTDDGAGPGETA